MNGNPSESGVKPCLNCDQMFPDKTKAKMAKFCSERCGTAYRNSRKYIDGIEGIDFIYCPVCHQRVAEVSFAHAKLHGFASVKEMSSHFGLKTLKSDNILGKMRGENNPGYNHGGTLSPWSSKNTRVDPLQLQANLNRAEESRKNTRPNEVNSWLLKGFSEEQAAAKVKERQTTFSLEICIGKLGLEEGTKRWNERQATWLKSFPNRTFSMISQELFWSILSNITDKDSIYFATKNRDGSRSNDGSNNEFRLSLLNSWILPDFVDLETKKIIEFDGSYWHSEAKSNPLREQDRDDRINQSGFKVFHVSEEQFRREPEKVIELCISYLKA